MVYEIEAQILPPVCDAGRTDEYYFVILLQAHLTFLWGCHTPFFALTLGCVYEGSLLHVSVYTMQFM